MRVRRAVAVAVAVIGSAGLVAGCAGGEPKDAMADQTAEQAAETLAASLSQGNADGVTLRHGNLSLDLPEMLRGMNGMLPRVTVDEVRHAGDSATVDLAYSWPLSSPWAYETRAVMVKDDSQWQLHWEPAVLHPRLTATTRLERQRGLTSDRGDITGRGNAVLVQNLPMQMLGLNKSGLDPAAAEDSARRIADEVSVNADDYAAKVAVAGPNAFVDAVPMRPAEVPNAFKKIRGADQRTVNLPGASTSGYARALLGTVGYATEEQARSMPGVAPGDVIGTSGLQRTYNSELRGSTGNRVFLADRTAPLGSGRPTTATLLADFPDVPGQSLATSIDDTIQSAAERTLADLKVPASVVVLRNGTGAILAAADSGIARRDNDSTTGRFGPGLAAGPMAALALMRSGVDLSEKVTCEKEVVIDGRKFENAKDYPRNGRQQTLAEAIAYDCVTAVAAVSGRLDPERLPEAAKSLGLGTNYDLGTPVNFGDFPAPPDAVAKAEALIGAGGRGRVHASALALATMAATVQAKHTVVPFVVPGREPQPESIPPLSEPELKALQDLMKKGAGSANPLVAVSSGESDGRSWTVGYSDAYAVAVVLRDDDKNRVTPAQIVRAVSTTAR